MRIKCNHPVGPIVNGVLFGIMEDSWAISDEVSEEQAANFLKIPREYSLFEGGIGAEHEEALEAAKRGASNDPKADPRDRQLKEQARAIADLTEVNANLGQRVTDLEAVNANLVEELKAAKAAPAAKPEPPAAKPEKGKEK